ncbi:MAG: hypothetical protein AB4372_24540 [Xenococcus sp. (in: cyanobacteria)]
MVTISNKITEIVDSLSDNNYFLVIASIASIIGLILFFFNKQRRPFYIVKSFNLIKDSSSTIENFDIKYKTEDVNGITNVVEIESLTISKILFWNGGRETINKSDIVDSAPVTIASKNPKSKILKSNIIKNSISNEHTNISVDRKTNNILFDFLESGNGVVIEVLHTGSCSDNLSLEGYVKNSQFSGKIKRKDMLCMHEFFTINHLCFRFFLMLFVWILIVNFLSLDTTNTTDPAIEFLVVLLNMFFLISFLVWPPRYPVAIINTIRIPRISHKIFKNDTAFYFD